MPEYNNGLVRANHNDVEPFAALAIRANQRAPRCVIPSNAIYASFDWHDPIQPYWLHVPYYRPVDCPLVPPRATRMHPIASRQQSLCPSVRIADRLPITRIVLIIAAETYRPILIATVTANGFYTVMRYLLSASWKNKISGSSGTLSTRDIILYI